MQEPLSASQSEEVMMAARLPSYPDVEFLLIVAAGVEPAEQGLLERNRDSHGWRSTFETNRVSVIRAASRTIGGIAGEELVQRFAEDNSTTAYGFWWEVDGIRDNVLVPHLSFTMDTGKGRHGPVPSSLSESVALALWDKISSSIRVRPTVGTHSTTAQVRLNPVGAGLADQAPARR
ncbi:T6SS immunity protein Tli4 family protein [Massilia sp. IC2-278]|uniref:T6SS immunity protein Tli4 family protein n=1 Tax=Massilia sp. IC2-278 TaxID=2887200 RepID=UPI0035A5E273